MKEIFASDYELLDSGNERKLERFGPFIFARPSASAVWTPSMPPSVWEKASAWFDRDGGNSWKFRQSIPDSWNISVTGIVFKLSITNFGHLGIFPEQCNLWKWIQNIITTAQAERKERISVLNLFAYSGGSTIAAAKAGACVCHLDASKGMVARARENAQINGIDNAPIRWIVEDVTKFLDRESRRNNSYDAIILDPPSFGRGKSGEVYKIERDIISTLDKCTRLLSKKPLFFLLSCHTPSFTSVVMNNLLQQALRKHDGMIKSGEMLLEGKKHVLPIPSGTFASWQTTKS
ncbi:MAG: class I SAM-dependent methyltransferase [Kiritimatiellae bacterium]|nr:class I SAM-dependent methyltransferase [Kiritimatiellia bacterium]MDD5521340.1 class I SAM-dependent methyltransferase [Kiritimatiellia bacterium]